VLLTSATTVSTRASSRSKQLGGSPRFELPEAAQEGFFGVLAAADKTDAEKLECFFGQVQAEQVLRQLGEKADGMGRDPETQALLRTIIDDERSTLAFLQQARELLCS